jgi:amidase
LSRFRIGCGAAGQLRNTCGVNDKAHPHPELATVTIQELRDRLESRDLTAVRLVEMHLERIEAVDRNGPGLHSIIELNPDALDIAERMDRERAAGHSRGPLHGIPILVKDNIDTGDRMLTTAGSLALAGAPASADAALVVRLREAGMVLLGKTNLSEWANFRSSRSASGWSGRGRQTVNPYSLDRSPSGSSSGSAVAVSAGLSPVAVGTETDGSVISPASVNGVVGFKPTVGRISGTGIVPIAASQDTAGPHARCVADAVELYACLAGIDVPFKLDAGALKGRRIGVLGAPFTGYSEHADRVFDEAMRALREAGAKLVKVRVPAFAKLRKSDAELTILLHEFKAGLDAYLKGRVGVPVGSLQDVIDFNLQHEAQEMPYFRQELLEMAQATTGLDSEKYAAAVTTARRLARVEGIDAAMARHNLDAFVAPSGSPAWVIDRISGDRFLGACSQPAAVAGYPHITVPAGLAIGALPVGLSLFGRPEREWDLLAMAHAFEHTIQGRQAPRYLPTVELP